MISEIFSNDISEIRLYTSVRGERVQPDILPTATVYVSNKDGEFPTTGTTLTVASVSGQTGAFNILVTPSAVAGYRFAKIVCNYTLPTYGAMEKVSVYEVKTRLIGYDEYNSTLGKDVTGMERTIPYDIFSLAESSARLAIEAYCMQNFNYWEGSRAVIAHPNFILLPQHADSIKAIFSIDENSLYSLVDGYRLLDGGFALEKKEKAPARSNERQFTIDAVWGYRYIPDAVRMAAVELTRDFTTGGLDNRRHYVQAAGDAGGDFANVLEGGVNSVSWRAFSDSTGNFIVDNLLTPYRVYQPSVI